MRRFLIAASCVFSVAIALESAPQKDNPAITVQGKVLQEPRGQPLRKASVQFIARSPDGQQNGPYSDTTDEEGRFKIENLKPGRYVTTIEHSGFVQSAHSKHSSILLQPGQGTTELVFYMQPAAVINGKVTDLDGDPMSNVSISAVRAGSAPRRMVSHDSGSAATNDLGEFRISGLRAGKYIISAIPPQGSGPQLLAGKDKNNKENLSYVTTYYPGTLNEEQALALEVHPGDEVPANFGVLASRTYRVSGKVGAVPDNSALSQVLLFSKDGRSTQNQQLGKDGSFEFLNVMPGSYTAELFFVSGISEGQPAVETKRVVEPIKVSTANVEGLELQATPDGSARGKFRMDTGQKFDWPQLNVLLIPAEQDESGVQVGGEFGRPAMSGVNQDGSFDLKKVPGGRYRLVVGARSNNLNDYITKSVSLDGRDVTDSGFLVSGETSLDVVISANGATIEGTVVDGKGKPAAEVTVVDIPATEHRNRVDLYQRDTTNEFGHFRLRGLSPGKYTVLAFDDLEADTRQPEFLKAYDARGEHVQLDEGSRANIVVKLIPGDDDDQ